MIDTEGMPKDSVHEFFSFFWVIDLVHEFAFHLLQIFTIYFLRLHFYIFIENLLINKVASNLLYCNIGMKGGVKIPQSIFSWSFLEVIKMTLF